MKTHKKSTLFGLACGACSIISLLGGETVPVQYSGSWKAANPEKNQFIHVTQDGKSNWGGLTVSAPVEAGIFYRISYRISGTGQSFPAAHGVNTLEAPGEKKKYIPFPVTGEHFQMYFRALESGLLKLTVASGTKRGQTLKLSDFQLEKLSNNDLKNINIPDSLSSWSFNGYQENAPYPMTVKADEKSPSGKAVNFQGTDVASFQLPILPGQEYTVSLWAKSTTAAPFQLRVCGYASPHAGKHFYQDVNMQLTDNYRQISCNVRIPDDLKTYPDLKSGMVRLRLISSDKKASISIAGVEFKEIQ